MTIIKTLEENANKIYVVIIVLVVASAFGLISLQTGVSVHEIGFHNFVAKIMGCKASSTTNFITGVTSFKDCIIETDQASILIALSAPIGAFFVGLALWLWKKDSILRIPAWFIMGYSAIPSLFPTLVGSDMYFAIAKGFPQIIGFTIFMLLLGVFTWIMIDEVTESQLFKKIERQLG